MQACLFSSLPADKPHLHLFANLPSFIMRLPSIIYWAATGIMCLIFLFSSYNYFFNYEVMAGFYTHLGFPTWLIYPSAILKILGVIAILSRQSNLLKEWAYAGFFFDASLALAAHTIAEDGAGLFAIVALISTLVSRVFHDQIFGKKA